MDRTNWGAKEVGAVASPSDECVVYGVSHPHQEAPLWAKWINWFLDAAEIQCEACDGRGDVSKTRCDRCEGQGVKLSRFGEAVMHAHEFFERLHERKRYRRSKRK